MRKHRIRPAPIPKWSHRYIGMMISMLVFAIFGALWIDPVISASLSSDGIPGDFNRVIEIGEIFSHGFGAILALVLVWQLAPHLRHRLAPLAGCLFLPGIAVQGIKLIIARKRPMVFEDQLPTSIADSWFGIFPDWQIGSEYAYQSFPSAHAATAVAMAIGLTWLMPRGRYVFTGMAILGTMQRIVSGAHWLSDVVAGGTIAFVVCFIVFRMERSREIRRVQNLRASRKFPSSRPRCDKPKREETEMAA